VDHSIQTPIQTQSVRNFHLQVADHDVFCGGGSVAAVTASSAASLMILVLGLSARRRANAPIRHGIETSIARAQEIQEEVLREADADMHVLQALLEEQQKLEPGGDRSAYVQALVSAASVPLSIARNTLELLEITEEMIGSASRFTVSDLGAAAGLAIGAIRAATLMSEVNLALLANEGDADPSQCSEMLTESRQLLQRGDEISSRIDETVRATIRQE
jgi:methenyltetrahydrofolate cyclohydrolase